MTGSRRHVLERCQFESSPYRYLWPLGSVRATRLVRERIRQRLGDPVPAGVPSQFAEGARVRVRTAAEIRLTLDADDKMRGLWFTDSQWSYCGQVLEVERVVRRMLDDQFRMRRISRTVTLAGATCRGAGGGGGCGRACALLFRDEWLEPTTAEPDGPAVAGYAVVRSLADIRATLDRHDRLDGLAFHPGMERYVGQRLPVLMHADLGMVTPAWKRPRGDWYVLAGVRCRGEPLGGEEACHRQCALLWHRTWLDLEPAAGGIERARAGHAPR